jgi:TPR repeat protein
MLARFVTSIGLQQDRTKATMELYTRAADLGNRKAHHNLASLYHKGGGMKHYEARLWQGMKCHDITLVI